MSRHPELYQWIDTVVMRFPSLRQAAGFGLGVVEFFGMVIARSCSLTAVADVLAPLLGSRTTRCAKAARYLPGSGAEAGNSAPKLDVTECWAPWLAWLFGWLVGQQMAMP